VTIERRLAARLIKRVPMQITPAVNGLAESVPAATMNISKSGAYFATSLKLREGAELELRLKRKLNPSRPTNANSLAVWRTSSPSVTMACAASASTSSIILWTDPR
jgi:hypothetical protein